MGRRSHCSSLDLALLRQQSFELSPQRFALPVVGYFFDVVSQLVRAPSLAIPKNCLSVTEHYANDLSEPTRESTLLVIAQTRAINRLTNLPHGMFWDDYAGDGCIAHINRQRAAKRGRQCGDLPPHVIEGVETKDRANGAAGSNVPVDRQQVGETRSHIGTAAHDIVKESVNAPSRRRGEIVFHVIRAHFLCTKMRRRMVNIRAPFHWQKRKSGGSIRDNRRFARSCTERKEPRGSCVSRCLTFPLDFVVVIVRSR
jgi:hypothetical protein